MMKKAIRPYRSTHRAGQAAQTRAAILDAADGLFRSKGWTATTIALIAAEAGVSAETVYSGFGNKRTILRTLVIAAVRRDAPGVPLAQQAGPMAVVAESDPVKLLGHFVHDIAEVLSRVAPLMAVVRSGSAAEPELASLYSELHEGRRKNLLAVAEALARTGGLRPDLTAMAALDTIWRLASPELFTLMHGVEGTSAEAFGVWLEDTLAHALLAPGPRHRG
jgi:AcrR family transcriptional regulator